MFGTMLVLLVCIIMIIGCVSTIGNAFFGIAAKKGVDKVLNSKMKNSGKSKLDIALEAYKAYKNL